MTEHNNGFCIIQLYTYHFLEIAFTLARGTQKAMPAEIISTFQTEKGREHIRQNVGVTQSSMDLSNSQRSNFCTYDQSVETVSSNLHQGISNSNIKATINIRFGLSYIAR